MKRFYLAKIRQVTHPVFGPVTQHEFQIAHEGVEFSSGPIATDAQGMPTAVASLLMVLGTDHSPYQNNPNIVPLPFVAMDSAVGSIATDIKLATKAKIKALGFDSEQTEQLWENPNSMRAVLEFYGKLNDPTFNADAFDLVET
jgi:hypothetical protein